MVMVYVEQLHQVIEKELSDSTLDKPKLYICQLGYTLDMVDAVEVRMYALKRKIPCPLLWTRQRSY